jgi:hypothetical protein
MYAQSRIAESLEGFHSRHGFLPEYHSIEEVEKANRLIAEDCREDSKGNIIFHPTPSQKRWILNERGLCWADSSYFETRYAYIVDHTNNVMKFSNRRSQEVFDEIIAQFDEKLVAIELLILKARQQGISTKVALKFLHRLLFIPRVQGIMGSISEEKSELLNRIMATCVDMLPWWLVPNVKKNRTGKLLEFHTGSILSIQSGSQQTGIGQGWTPVLIHISECGDYPNPKKTLEEGLMRATHPSASLFSVYEGTGNGSTGWWADTWRTARDRYPQGRSRLCPVFIPWHMATDLYPSRDWLKKYPVPAGWEPEHETIQHARKCEAYVHHTELLKNILGRDWRLPRDQQWYWSFNYFEAKDKHCEKIWLQQMSADDREALIGKNDTVFSPETIEVISRERERSYRVYGIIGDGVREEFHARTQDIDYSAERIPVSWDTQNGNALDWLLIPLKPVDETEVTTAMNKLLMFEPPEDGCDYGVGIDTGTGIGEDRTVISGARTGRDETPDRQVAEFRSDRILTSEVSNFAACIGAIYAPVIPNYRQPKFCIEQVRKYGDDPQVQLKKMGFFRHHVMIRYDGKRVREQDGRKEGFFTHTWSRPLLVGRFIDAINNGWYEPQSPYLIQELESWEQKVLTDGKTKIEHQSGKKDDHVFAAALSYFTMHHLDVMMERAKKKYNRPKNTLPEIDMSFFNPLQMRVSDGRERL